MNYLISGSPFWGATYFWCIDTFGPESERWHIHFSHEVIYEFKNEEDAVLFALKWGNVDV